MALLISGKTKTERVLLAFAEYAPPVLRQHFNDRSCLNSTWVAKEVLAAFDIELKPMVVDAMYFNAGFAALAYKYGHFPQSIEEREAWFAENGAHSVGTVRGKVISADGWEGGHLIGVTNRFLVDASARQFHRPQHKMPAPPVLVATIEPEFYRGANREVVPMVGGGVMLYSAFPNDTAYVGSPGYYDSPLHQRMASGLIRSIKSLRLR